MHAVVPNATNPLENLFETYLAKSVPPEEYAVAFTKQYRYKQNPQWHPLICGITTEVLGQCILPKPILVDDNSEYEEE